MLVTRPEIYRRLAIKLRNEHLRNCLGEQCDTSLIHILEMAQDAGAKFSQTELQEWHSTAILRVPEYGEVAAA